MKIVTRMNAMDFYSMSVWSVTIQLIWLAKVTLNRPNFIDWSANTPQGVVL